VVEGVDGDDVVFVVHVVIEPVACAREASDEDAAAERRPPDRGRGAAVREALEARQDAV
jgi:hypothetical protein